MMRHLAGYQLLLLIFLWPQVGQLWGQSSPGADQPEHWLTLLDGPRRKAEFVAVNSQDQVVFQESDQQRLVAWNELVRWGSFVDHSRGSMVLLADGGMLVADVLAVEEDTVTVVGGLWSQVRLPRRQVRAILFRVPGDIQRRDRLFERIHAEQTDTARLLLENGDQLRGHVVVPVRAAPGGFHPTSLTWQVPAVEQPFEVPIQRVLAIVFGTSPGSSVAADAAEKLIGFRDGSQLHARTIARQQDQLELNLVGPIRLVTEPTVTPAADPWQAVVSLQSRGDHVTYLSDLEPYSYKHLPYFDLSWPYREDRSVSGGRLRFAGQLFAKGIGMHSSSRLAYNLAGRYQRLQAELAIDQRAGRAGSVVFRVYLATADDGWHRVFESEVVRGGQPPVPMDVSIDGAQQLALIVDAADRADQGDHANWLNARLIK